jgi:putative hydrolase of the HAD superfamily
VIRAVTFDAAGTLFAPREPVGTTYARIARRFGLAADPGEIETAFRRALRAAPPLAFPGASTSVRARRERAWWRDVVHTSLCFASTVPRFEECFDALFAHYASAAAWQVFPDVAPTLGRLRHRGLRLAVVSNFDGRLPALLAALDLAPAFDGVLWSSAVGAAKPAGAIFDAAARALGVELGTLSHVGDDLDADVAGARLAGAWAIHLDRSGRSPGAITTLADLCAQLDRL